MVKMTKLDLLTEKEFQLISVKDAMLDFVKKSGIQNGVVFVITAHTTSGILVNENLKCLYTDIESTLDRLVPTVQDYAHSHFLPSYGATGGNAPGHLKSMLCGNHAVFPIQNGEVQSGMAQDVFFAEFDGPQMRHLFIQVQGE